jgi:glucose-6-phosphate-specific signal transduction histidine kinase
MKTLAPQQLSLPVPDLLAAIAQQKELAQVQAACEELHRENQRLKEELVKVRQAGRDAPDEAYRRIHALQIQCDFLYELLRTPTSHSRAASRPEALAQRTWMHRELTTLLATIHPDKWSDHPAATELTKNVIELRQRLKEMAP